MLSGPISAIAVSTQAAVHQARRRTSRTQHREEDDRTGTQVSPGAVSTCEQVVQRDGPVVAGVQRLADHAVEAQLRPEVRAARPRPSSGDTTHQAGRATVARGPLDGHAPRSWPRTRATTALPSGGTFTAPLFPDRRSA